MGHRRLQIVNLDMWRRGYELLLKYEHHERSSPAKAANAITHPQALVKMKIQSLPYNAIGIVNKLKEIGSSM